MKYLMSMALFLFVCNQALAAEITPENLPGKYFVNGRVAFKQINLAFKVLNDKEFEIQRLYADGRQDQICSGSYTLSPTLFWNVNKFDHGKMFKGFFTCPNNRTQNFDFSIDFANKSIDNLIQGTNIIIKSTFAHGMKIKAYIKRQI
ncbi:MAG: hypothetical protein ACXVCY_08940 [Pseudobdellovibrionaceae bacterium]